MSLRLGTRGSPLARWQAGHAAEALRSQYPGMEIDTVVVKTSGDHDQSTPLDNLPHPGYFTRELETALADGRIDVAIHSLKDMAARVDEPYRVAAVLPRGPAGDVLVLNARYSRMNDLPADAAFLTGSVRRAQQLRTLFPGCTTRPVRGNIHTRLRKLAATGADGLVVAAAALARLEIDGHPTAELPLDKVVPAPGQAAIALEVLASRSDLGELLEPLESAVTRRATDMERHLAYLLEGGCSLPLGAHASPDSEDGDLLFRASLGTAGDTQPVYRQLTVGPSVAPSEAAETMAAHFRNVAIPG
ncbi:MAG: hydroxymethylbilane synthase [Candidatus Neomarinimicrobiota bacterium]